jgi:hypothetical protein
MEMPVSCCKQSSIRFYPPIYSNKDVEYADLPLFLRDLTAIHRSKPESDIAALNARLNVLGWHYVQLDYQPLQLALAWV